jgi:hypothetical protein
MSCSPPPARSIRRRPSVAAGRTLVASLACAVVLAALADEARAYSTPDASAEQPALGGGGGRWFTGSPADGFGCTVCHAPASGQRHFPLRVAGLPSDGYVPGQRQEIVLAWHEFAARWAELRPDPAAPAVPGQASPAVGLVGELVAESGLGSGTIEIDTANPGPDELCEMARPNLKPRLAARLYQVRSGRPPRPIRADANGVLRCESRLLGQRCVVAISSCGSKSLRFAWTAPPTWEGPIWLSAGFVASEALSGTPAQDSVDEVAIPIMQADVKQETYRQVLRSGCGLSPARPTLGGAAAPWLAGCALWVVLRARRRASPRGRGRT